MIEPVVIYHERDHVFIPPVPKPKKGKGRCQQCGRGFSNLDHLGAPESLNVGGSGSNHWAYQNAKKMWQDWVIKAVELEGLPKKLKAVQVEGKICFPTLHARDEGNFRYLLEKATGDALQEGGWIKDDQFFPQPMYSFGKLDPTYEKDISYVKLIFFPTPHPERETNLWVKKVQKRRARKLHSIGRASRVPKKSRRKLAKAR